MSSSDWMAGWPIPTPPLSPYHTLMACRLVVLDKSPGVRPVGIGETIRLDFAKLLMRAEEKQAKTAGGNLQMCAGVYAGIEGSTHALGQQRLERSRARRCEEVVRVTEEEEE